MRDVVFIFLGVITVFGALLVAFAKHIVTSVFGLLLALVGIASLYIFLSADFVAVSQVLIYIGGVIILLLFVLMLTGRISEFSITNPASRAPLAFVFSISFFALSVYVISHSGIQFVPANPEPTTRMLGHLLLRDYVLPFEFVSFLVVVLLVGSVVLIRKELIKNTKGDKE